MLHRHNTQNPIDQVGSHGKYFVREDEMGRAFPVKPKEEKKTERFLNECQLREAMV